MSDIIDDANDAADLYLKSAIHQQRKKKSSVPAKGHGACFYCGAAIKEPRRWCNALCRDEWEAETK